MKLGITMSLMDKDGKLLDAGAWAEQARNIERAGFDAAYMGHRMAGPVYPDSDRYDPLMGLLVAATATSHIELGTCVVIAGPLNKYDLFMRLYTLESMAPGRSCIGVGTGSGKGYYESVGLDWDDRYRRLADNMKTIKAMFEGGPIENPEANSGMTFVRGQVGGQEGRPDTSATNYAKKASRPRFVLGAWHSELQLKKAVADYDGWMASAGAGAKVGGWRKVLGEAIKRYRDLGGTRAMISSVSVDLNADAKELSDEGGFNLQCPPNEAADRLNELAELGFDDVVLNRADQYTKVGPQGFRYYSTLEELEEIRALVPEESRVIRSS